MSSFDDMTLLYRRCWRFLGILPLDGRDLTCPLTRGALAFSLTMSLISMSMQLVYTINVEKGLSASGISETMGAVGASLRYYVLLWRRLEFAKLLEDCREIWELCDEDGRREVKRLARRVRLLFLLFLANVLVINVAYSASAIYKTLHSAATATHNDSNKPTLYLPYKWYTADGAYRWPGYQAIFFIQVLAVSCLSAIVTGVDTAGPMLIMMGAGYCRVLRRDFLRIGDDETDQLSNADELVACARLHQRILNFCGKVEKTLSIMFFIQLMCSCYNISLICIKLIGSDPDRYKYLPMLTANIGILFVCQWAPEHLVDESLSISTAAYFASLTWMKSRYGRLLVLVIARSQQPIQMTAAGIVQLSLENFRAMLTSAISFFTVLRNLNT